MADGDLVPPEVNDPTPTSLPAALGGGTSPQGSSSPQQSAMMPNVGQLISQLIKPTAQVRPGDTGDTLTRPSRLDAFEQFLGTFLQSFSAGMSQSGQGPAANARGFGAAMMAPRNLAIQNQQLGQQAAQSGAAVQNQQAEAQLKTAQAGQLQNTIQTPLGPMNPALAEKMFAAQAGAQSKVEAAGVQKRYIPTPSGLYDTQTKSMAAGQAGGVTVTKDIASQYNIPEQLIGKNIPISQFASMERGGAMDMATVQGAAGPAIVQKTTGKVTPLNLGPPSMGGLAIVSGDNGIQYVPKSQAVGQTPGAALGATERVNVQKNDVALQNAIPRVKGMLENSGVLSSMIDAGKISLAVGANGDLQAVVGRGATLSPKEAKFAADFQTMSEDINLLRGPMAATGFRGPEAFSALQAQRGRLFQNPQVFKAVLQNTLQTFNQLHDVNTETLKNTGSGKVPSGGADPVQDLINKHAPK